MYYVVLNVLHSTYHSIKGYFKECHVNQYISKNNIVLRLKIHGSSLSSRLNKANAKCSDFGIANEV